MIRLWRMQRGLTAMCLSCGGKDPWCGCGLSLCQKLGFQSHWVPQWLQCGHMYPQGTEGAGRGAGPMQNGHRLTFCHLQGKGVNRAQHRESFCFHPCWMSRSPRPACGPCAPAQFPLSGHLQVKCPACGYPTCAQCHQCNPVMARPFAGPHGTSILLGVHLSASKNRSSVVLTERCPWHAGRPRNLLSGKGGGKVVVPNWAHPTAPRMAVELILTGLRGITSCGRGRGMVHPVRDVGEKLPLTQTRAPAEDVGYPFIQSIAMTGWGDSMGVGQGNACIPGNPVTGVAWLALGGKEATHSTGKLYLRRYPTTQPPRTWTI